MSLRPAEAGVELGSVEVIPGSDLTFTTTTDTNISGMQKTVTVGSRPILVTVNLEMQNAQAATVYGIVKLWEDNVLVAEWRTTSSTTQYQFLSFARSKRRAPAAGSHTYRVTMRLNNATARQLNILTGSLNSLMIQQL